MRYSIYISNNDTNIMFHFVFYSVTKMYEMAGNNYSHSVSDLQRHLLRTSELIRPKCFIIISIDGSKYNLLQFATLGEMALQVSSCNSIITLCLHVIYS